MALQKCGLNINSGQKELKPHGTVEFPCAGYTSCHTDNPNDAVLWHWHEEIEIIFIQKGTMKLQIPSREYILEEESLTVLNSNMLHYAIGQPFCELRSLVFSPFLITGGSSTVFYKKYIYPLLTCADFTVYQPNSSELTTAFQTAYSALADETFAYEFTVRESLCQIVVSCIQKFAPVFHIAETKKDTDTIRIEKMLEYIYIHFFEPITLKDIAQSADLSERECLRCFHRAIGDTPVQHLMKYRLMQSASMLQSSPNASIAEVAAACGFDQPSYYSKQFKRFYQCTPKDYRSQNI